MFKGLGSILNDLTGATSAANLNQQYALQSGEINHLYQKEFAQNAHQWEIEDLKKAGLNPVLSAGGSGAAASGGGVGSGSIASAGMSPFDLVNTAIGSWNGVENARLTGAKAAKVDSEIKNLDQDTILKHWETLTEMEKGKLTKAQRDKIKTEKQKILALLPDELKNLQTDTYLKDEQRKYTEKQRKKHTTEKGANGKMGVHLGPFGYLGIEGGGNTKF